MGAGGTSRTDLAEATRRRIVAAGRALFTAQGYQATSMADIASAAGVSVQTIYDSLGSKSAIVLALNDLVDVEADVRTLAARIPHADHPRELIEIVAQLDRNIEERCGDLVAVLFSAAEVEPGLVPARDEARRRHRAGVGRIADRLVALGGLRDDVDRDLAADLIGAATSSEVIGVFVKEYGWSLDRWQQWTVATLAEQLLKPEFRVRN